MRWIHIMTISLLAASFAATGNAAKLKGSVSAGAEYDSNVFRTDLNERDDFIFRITPKVSLYDDDGKLGWNVNYQMPWERGIQFEKVDDLSHYVQAGFDYQFTEATRAYFNDRFSYAFNQNFRESGAPTVSDFREPVTRNEATVGVEHLFSPRTTGRASFTHRLFQSDIRNRSDNMTFVLDTGLFYQLTQRHQVGGGLATSYQDFDESNDNRRPPSQTLFVNMFASWVWLLDETTTFSARGGPTFIDNDQDAPPSVIPNVARFPNVDIGGGERRVLSPDCGTVNGTPVLGLCPVQELPITNPADIAVLDDPNNFQNLTFGSGGNPGSQSDSSWTYFGDVRLTRRWTPEVVSEVGYSRSQSTASGLGGSAVRDWVEIILNWKISELWAFSVRADWTQRESTSDTSETFVIAGPEFMLPSGRLIATTVGEASNPGEGLPGLSSQTVRRLVDTMRWGAAARLTRRITKNLTAGVRYTYNQQDSAQNSAGNFSDFSDHVVGISVQYDFEPWRIW